MPSENPVLRFLRALSLWDRIVYGLVLLFFLVGFLGRPVWGLIDPRLPTSEAYLNNTASDPWGRPWAEVQVSVSPYVVRSYSLGPNGLDEGGQGDDVAVLDGVRFGFSNTLLFDLYANLGGVSLFLSVFVLGGWELARAMRARLLAPRSPALISEAGRAAVLAIPFAVFTGLAGVVLATQLDEHLQTLEGFLVVEPPLAAGGSGVLLSYMAVLWLRLRQPLEAEGESPPAAAAEPAAGP